MAVALLQEFRKEGYDARRVTDAQLGDDWRLVAAKYATMRSGGRTEFADERELVLFAEGIVREILRRGKMTFHPDAMEPTTLDLLRECLSRIVARAVYLVEPHGEWIHEGRKTAVVKARRYEALEQFNVLVSGGKAWGFLRCAEPEEIGLEEFTRRHREHRISEEERQEWWPDASRLYLYPVRDYVPLERPRQVTVPRGAQTFFPLRLAESFPRGPEDLAAMSDAELMRFHRVLHQLYARLFAKAREAGSLRVDLGCGNRKPEGYLGIDLKADSDADIVWDLNLGIPLPDSCADEVRAHHVLEHLWSQVAIMDEIWRVLKPGGILDAEVPSTKGQGAFADPTHRTYWNALTFRYFVEDALREECGAQAKFEIVELSERENRQWGTVYTRAILKAVKPE